MCDRLSIDPVGEMVSMGLRYVWNGVFALCLLFVSVSSTWVPIRCARTRRLC